MIKWPFFWKNIKIFILSKQLILSKLIYRFNINNIIIKKAKTQIITLLFFRLWATKKICKKINLVPINQKIQMVFELKNIFLSRLKIKSKVLKIKNKIIECLFELVANPVRVFWKNNVIKKVLKNIKTKLICNKRISKFYFITYFIISIKNFLFYKWSKINYKLIFKNWTLFLNLILNKFKTFVWKNLLFLTIKNFFIQKKIFLFKNLLWFKKIVFLKKYLKFLNIDFIYIYKSIRVFYNNIFFMHNFVSTKIYTFFKKKGIYISK